MPIYFVGEMDVSSDKIEGDVEQNTSCIAWVLRMKDLRHIFKLKCFSILALWCKLHYVL